MASLAATYGDEMRELAASLCRVDTSSGNEAPGQAIVNETLTAHGFEVFEWTAEAATLAGHPSFPPADHLDVADRPSVGGVLEFGDPDRGPTLVFNGHVDVVPASGEG